MSVMRALDVKMEVVLQCSSLRRHRHSPRLSKHKGRPACSLREIRTGWNRPSSSNVCDFASASPSPRALLPFAPTLYPLPSPPRSPSQHCTCVLSPISLIGTSPKPIGFRRPISALAPMILHLPKAAMRRGVLGPLIGHTNTTRSGSRHCQAGTRHDAASSIASRLL